MVEKEEPEDDSVITASQSIKSAFTEENDDLGRKVAVSHHFPVHQ